MHHRMQAFMGGSASKKQYDDDHEEEEEQQQQQQQRTRQQHASTPSSFQLLQLPHGIVRQHVLPRLGPWVLKQARATCR